MYLGGGIVKSAKIEGENPLCLSMCVLQSQNNCLPEMMSTKHKTIPCGGGDGERPSARGILYQNVIDIPKVKEEVKICLSACFDYQPERKGIFLHSVIFLCRQLCCDYGKSISWITFIYIAYR